MLDLDMQQIPAPGTSRLDRLDRLKARLAAGPDAWALFLDIDGTLLDMAPSPDAVEVPPGLVDTLARLKRHFNGAIALITGRRIADADRFFAPLKLVALGVHGAEARKAPRGGITMLGEPIPAALTRAIYATADALPGILVEDKGVGLAVHYRHAPESAPVLERELRRLVRSWDGFAVRPGRKVLEVVPRAHSKGTGLMWLMQLPAFQGRQPVMIGDDHGDEPALAAARSLGGAGLRVSGEHFCDTAELDGPAHVRAWLSDIAAPQAGGR